VTLDDKSARIDVRFFPDMYEQFESVLETDRILLIKGQVSFDDFSGGNTITARDVMDIVQHERKTRERWHLILIPSCLNLRK
jgi:DNA polymerase III, alpha subunit